MAYSLSKRYYTWYRKDAILTFFDHPRELKSMQRMFHGLNTNSTHVFNASQVLMMLLSRYLRIRQWRWGLDFLVWMIVGVWSAMGEYLSLYNFINSPCLGVLVVLTKCTDYTYHHHRKISRIISCNYSTWIVFTTYIVDKNPKFQM